jgi:CRISPR/Cas system-associated exonuclease Cas4 (RecB family)
MQILRASEISSYLFCKRAWWYQLQAINPENLDELASGHDLHKHHGRIVVMSGLLRVISFLMLLSAMILLAIYITGLIL